MRSRTGGFIGPAIRPTQYGSANGVWTLGEEYIARAENQWPRNYLDVTYSGGHVDATNYGSATINPSVWTNLDASYVWEKSVNNGSTWTTISGETGSYIVLSGLSHFDDGDLYRMRASSGLRSRSTGPIELWYESSFDIQWNQPSDVTIDSGQQASFYASTQSVTGVTHGGGYVEINTRWQQSSNGGATWVTIEGAAGGWFPVIASPELNGRKYRFQVQISHDGGWYSSLPATLTVT